MKILIVKTSSMGDVVHALPVAYDIKQHYSNCQLDWIVEESFRDIPKLSPFVDQVKLTAFRRWRKEPLSARTRSEVSALKTQLEHEQYDLVLDIQGLLRSAWVARWTKSPRLIGYSFNTVRERLASFFYGEHLPLSEDMGAVRRYRAAAGLALDYVVDPTIRFSLQAKEHPSIEPPFPYVALAVNTSRDSKLWPEDNWVLLSERLYRCGLGTILFWGNEKEKERVERLAQRMPQALIAPRTGLASTASALQRAQGLVGVDTGLSHLGAALGRPSVGIFVSTSIDRLQLIGDGPVASLGGIGQCPDIEAVWSAFQKVMGDKL